MSLSLHAVNYPDLRGAEAALVRAAAAARELGRRTGTPVYVLRDGKSWI